MRLSKKTDTFWNSSAGNSLISPIESLERAFRAKDIALDFIQDIKVLGVPDAEVSLLAGEIKDREPNTAKIYLEEYIKSKRKPNDCDLRVPASFKILRRALKNQVIAYSYIEDLEKQKITQDIIDKLASKIASLEHYEAIKYLEKITTNIHEDPCNALAALAADFNEPGNLYEKGIKHKAEASPAEEPLAKRVKISSDTQELNISRHQRFYDLAKDIGITPELMREFLDITFEDDIENNYTILTQFDDYEDALMFIQYQISEVDRMEYKAEVSPTEMEMLTHTGFYNLCRNKKIPDLLTAKFLETAPLSQLMEHFQLIGSLSDKDASLYVSCIAGKNQDSREKARTEISDRALAVFLEKNFAMEDAKYCVNLLCDLFAANIDPEKLEYFIAIVLLFATEIPGQPRISVREAGQLCSSLITFGASINCLKEVYNKLLEEERVALIELTKREIITFGIQGAAGHILSLNL